ncbi:hypothetical protein ANN_22543 [Periplaneta americana]|uniref:Uncharacterized protein n=1 Tax=Periplaneta americana TaxID=6978 RepID=A0ABQ8S8K8_PERAM|nr:hypothetical protein ANN_22543 [Periplaneta americana]
MASSSDEGAVLSVVKKRKKGLKSVEYKREHVKRGRVKGLEHINYASKVVAKKKIGNDCKCKLKCFGRLLEGDREEIFINFYAKETKDEQDSYLQALVEVVQVKRRRQQGDEPKKPRSRNFKYYVTCSSGRQQVCAKAFLNLPGVTKVAFVV